MNANEVIADAAMAVDCDMNAIGFESRDAGCAAVCALVCPGFYSGPDMAFADTVAFELTQYVIPMTGPGMAPPAHLDPPPPRI